jgi:hypothetical protein
VSSRGGHERAAGAECFSEKKSIVRENGDRFILVYAAPRTAVSTYNTVPKDTAVHKQQEDQELMAEISQSLA